MTNNWPPQAAYPSVPAAHIMPHHTLTTRYIGLDTAIAAIVKKLSAHGHILTVCYETGPTSYVLDMARQVQSMGHGLSIHGT
jgi:hypothetical protein